MSAKTKLFFRKMKGNLAQLICVGLLVAVGIGFFITLHAIVNAYEDSAEQYFLDNNYASVTFYGSFSEQDVAIVDADAAVQQARGRYSADYRNGDVIIRAISLADNINIPHLYSGRLPNDGTECIVVKRNVDKWNTAIGQSIQVGGVSLQIVGIMDTPEYIYLVKNERTPMADSNKFGVIYTHESFFSGSYNEIVALSSSDDAGYFRTLLPCERVIMQQNQSNYENYVGDLEQIRTFAFIFPSVFAILIVAVIFVMLRRAMVKDNRQIGVYKALGLSDKKIVLMYMGQYCLVVAVNALIGCLGAIVVTNILIGIFKAMFVVPSLSFTFYPLAWAGSVLVSVLMCAAITFFSLTPILKTMPANSMRPPMPKSGKKILLEKTRLWKRLSFNSRYALKSTLRNKGRFFASLMGILGATTVLVFSLGFNDSLTNTQNEYFDNFASYDIIASFDPVPLQTQHPLQQDVDSYAKSLRFYGDVNEKECIITVVDEGFDMLNIPAHALNDGVVLPQFYAREWGVSEGDTVEVMGQNVVVSAVVVQTLGLQIFAGFEYLQSNQLLQMPLYNTLFLRGGNTQGAIEWLNANNVSYSTLDDDKETFAAISESIHILVGFMLACSILLGFTVLYSVGLINLSSRQYEYMFMGVMGYSQKKISFALIKEYVVLVLLSIPLGFLLGNVIIHLIKDSFSGDNFVILPKTFLPSYIITFFIVVSISAFMVAITSKFVSRLNIVEGLKEE